MAGDKQACQGSEVDMTRDKGGSSENTDHSERRLASWLQFLSTYLGKHISCRVAWQAQR